MTKNLIGVRMNLASYAGSTSDQLQLASNIMDAVGCLFVLQLLILRLIQTRHWRKLKKGNEKKLTIAFWFSDIALSLVLIGFAMISILYLVNQFSDPLMDPAIRSNLDTAENATWIIIFISAISTIILLIASFVINWKIHGWRVICMQNLFSPRKNPKGHAVSVNGYKTLLLVCMVTFASFWPSLSLGVMSNDIEMSGLAGMNIMAIVFCSLVLPFYILSILVTRRGTKAALTTFDWINIFIEAGLFVVVTSIILFKFYILVLNGVI